MNYGFIIDNRKCIGCHACTVACKAEHDVPIGVNRTWVKYIEKGEFPNSRRLFSVMRCNHCIDAPCVEICPVEALHIRDDGIVDFDNRRCIGCKACTQACPYDALYIDPNTHTAAKCNYCAHRVDIGLEPACVNVCPEHAIISGDMDNPHSEISQLLSREQVTARKVEKGTRPKLFYIDGDAASLIPSLTERSSNYMWNSQASGVGHFAKYAEKLIAKSDPVAMTQQLSGSGNSKAIWIGDAGGSSEKVLVPSNGADSRKMLQKAMEVLKEGARRVYDAPSKGVVWGWEVSAYVWTKAIAAGAFLVVFIAMAFGLSPVAESTQWLGIALGLLFLGLTGALLVKDLDKPTRFTYVLMRPHWSSWLVRGGYSITFYGGFLTLWGVVKLFGWYELEPLALWGSAIFAVITAVYTAFLFAQAKGRDFWQSPTLSLHMLVHSVIAGAAALSLLTLVFGAAEGWQSYLKSVFSVGIVFNLVVIVSEIITTHPTTDAKNTVKMIVSGRYRMPFWLGTMILGNILPLVLLLVGGAALLPISGALVLIGMYVTEHIWVRAPQLIPLS
jgi:Fe-S-cluster-containing dehydrogenase component/formate-dependent nitrite reductase membrane component NrfD